MSSVVLNLDDTSQRCGFPQTVYAVAVAYCHPVGKGVCAVSTMFVVSGIDPLTDDEVIARGRKDTDARLKAAGGTVAESVFCSASFTVMTQRLPD